jgi:hypothetical protein
MKLEIHDIRTRKGINDGWVAWVDFSHKQAFGKTEGQAIDKLVKELHLKISQPHSKN